VRQLSDAALREETTALLRELVRIDTSNPPGGETPAALLLKDYLESAGVECELVAKVPERANLVARIRGRGRGPSLALLGHTDVVPADAGTGPIRRSLVISTMTAICGAAARST
jgi:Acetylornithine deacetylase/Succinyl-diaminopimelate desuccinylase and related deacylases